MNKKLLAVSCVYDSGYKTLYNVIEPERKEEVQSNAASFEKLVFEPITSVVTAEDDDLEQQVRDLLCAAHISCEVYSEDEFTCVEIIWGDWKHDHATTDYLVDKAFGLKLIKEIETEENGSDAYSAIHYYK